MQPKKPKVSPLNLVFILFFLAVLLNGTLQKQKFAKKRKIGCGLLFEDVTQFEYVGMALKIMNGI
jgi:hypothetical protein